MFSRILPAACLLLGLGLLLPGAAFAQSAATNTATLPRPDRVYSAQSAAGVPVTLERYGTGDATAVTFHLGDRDHPSGQTIPLAEQGRLLEHLFGRLQAENPELPAKFPVFLAESRTALTAALVDRLRQSGADWDGKRGRPRQGAFGPVLQRELAAVIAASPLATALAAHGYALELTEIGRIDIQPLADAGGGRYPKTIDIMTLNALQLRK